MLCNIPTYAALRTVGHAAHERKLVSVDRYVVQKQPCLQYLAFPSQEH